MATPCEPCKAEHATAPERLLPSSARVLVADDVKVNGKLIEITFRKFVGTGWTVQCVGSAELAVEVARETSFDVIIMDMMFSPEPGSMTGLDAVREIRHNELVLGLNRARIVMCSGCDVDTDSMAGAGADALWPKPFPAGADGSLQAKLAELFVPRGPVNLTDGAPISSSILAVPTVACKGPSPLRSAMTLLSNPSATGGNSCGSSGASSPRLLPSSAKILVADDVKMTGKLIEMTFRKFVGTGWTVQCVGSAELAVEVARETSFDVIIMDMMFSPEPGSMTGLDAVREIRHNELVLGLNRARIVMCSGCDVDTDSMAEAGADALWSKPFPAGADGSLQAALASLFRARLPEGMPSEDMCLLPEGVPSETMRLRNVEAMCFKPFGTDVDMPDFDD